jgi:hypothetical protein
MFPVRGLPLLASLLVILAPAPASAVCWLLAPEGHEVRMPAVQVFLSIAGSTDTLIVQPEFVSTSDVLGIVFATPTKPTVEAAPRDFFHALGRFTQLKHRVFPESRLLPLDDVRPATATSNAAPLRRPQRVRLLDENLADPLALNVVSANEFGAMVGWMRENQFPVDPKLIDPWVRRGWFFTFARIDAKQLRKDRDDRYRGTIAPIRLTYNADEPLLPMALAQPSAGAPLDFLCYVEAGPKMDLPEGRSYQYYWVPFLKSVQADWPRGVLPGKGHEWLKIVQGEIPAILSRGAELGFVYAQGRPTANKLGRVLTRLEWAKRLTDADIEVLKGTVAPSETVPDLDEGFTDADLRQPQRAEAIRRVIQKRRAALLKEHPEGFIQRDLSAADAAGLKALTPFLKPGVFVTRLRAGLSRDELKGDLLLKPAQWGAQLDQSEYDERLQRKDD